MKQWSMILMIAGLICIAEATVCLLGAALMESLGHMKIFLLLFGGLLLFYIYTLWINKRYLGSYTLMSGEEGKARRFYAAVVLILYLAIFLGFSWYAGLLNHSLAMFLITAGILLAAQMILFRKKK